MNTPETVTSQLFKPYFDENFMLSPDELLALQPPPELNDDGNIDSRYKRFARHMPQFTHGLTELKESALSYRNVAHGLIAAYIVLHAVAQQEDMSTSKYIIMEIKPKVTAKGKSVAYALRHIRRNTANGELIGDESPGAVIILGSAFDRDEGSNNTLNFTIGGAPQVQNATLGGEVSQIIGIYSTNPIEFPTAA